MFGLSVSRCALLLSGLACADTVPSLLPVGPQGVLVVELPTIRGNGQVEMEGLRASRRQESGADSCQLVRHRLLG